MSAPSRRQFLRRSADLSAGLAAVTWIASCSGSSDTSGERDAPDRTAATSAPVDTGDPTAVGVDAFLAGFPLVTTVRTMQTFAQFVGVNRLFVGRGLASPTSRFVVAPNRDTVYALAILDLRDGPFVLTLPDMPDRYHVFQFIDAWMGNVALVGTRTTGGRAGSWVIVPPGSDAATPRRSKRLESPTNQMFMLGRIRAVDDADAVRASAFGTTAKLEALASRDGSGAPARTMPPPVGTPQTVGSNGAAYFDELGDLLAVNPPTTPAQRQAIEAAATLGVGPGRHPSVEQTGAERAALEAAVVEGRREIASPTTLAAKQVNGWSVNTKLGDPSYTPTILGQAVIARYFWGPVPASEAIYPRAVEGSDGEPLDGSKRYRIHFAEDRVPPVDGFWSVTVYGPDMFPVVNAANRYSLSGDTPGLVTNADGSLDLHLQHDAPADPSNWLPVPEGSFNVIMRLYLPRAPIRNGKYEYPPVEVVDRASP